MLQHIDLTGQVFGLLTVVQRYIDPNAKGKRQQHAKWLCQCECGNQRIVMATNLKKKSGTISCGCQKRKNWQNIITKHGLYYTDEHSIYQNMLSRCYNEKDKFYYTYGALGIKVCDEWLGNNGLENFVKDMGMKPFKEASLDRIDNNKGYSKNNCQWINKNEQSRNRNYNKIKDINHANQIRDQYRNQGISASKLAKINNCSTNCIYHIINDISWI